MNHNVEYLAQRLFYLRNKERGYLGNAPLWWVKDGQGYSDNLSRAQQFTDAESAKMVADNPDKWERWPCALIDRYAYRTFDSQDFGKIKEEMERGARCNSAR